METREIMRQLLSKGTIKQVGFFTRDIFKAMENWDNILGVSNWTLYAHSQDRLQNIARREGLCGEEFKFYAACAMLGKTQIELIQPLYGLPFYEDYLANHGEGAHHMKLVVPQEHYDEILDDLAKNGMPVLFGAEFFGSKFYFVDSVQKLGILLEIGNGKFPEGMPKEWAISYPQCLELKRNEG